MIQRRKIQGINPMGLSASWDDNNNNKLFEDMKIKQATLRYNTNKLQ